MSSLFALLAFVAPVATLDVILSDPKLDGAIVSAIVTDLDGRVVYERNSRTHVVPASNMKLLSNSFALYELGPDTRRETRIWKQPDRTIIESTGDPMLTHDQLVGARNRLQLDRSAPVELREEFAPLWAGNWEFGDLGNKYAAPVCAFTVDRGGFEIWADKGRPVFKPEAYGTRVCISDSPSAQMRYDPVQRTLTASKGAFAKNGRLDTLSLPHPDEAAASLLGRGFRRTESTPSRPPDLVIAGPRTIDIVSACLPPSDNQLAEQLLLLGARAEGPLGSDPYKTAQARLGNFLVRVVGADPNDLRIDDGSGLSRHNYVTTRLIAKLLAWENGLPTAAGWRAALAHAGSGTLASRLKGLTFVGKTGSLDMVVALSGYVQCADGHERIVSVILNEFGCSAREARDVADAFVSAVASFSF